jgi:hypothetical protein
MVCKNAPPARNPRQLERLPGRLASTSNDLRFAARQIVRECQVKVKVKIKAVSETCR